MSYHTPNMDGLFENITKLASDQIAKMKMNLISEQESLEDHAILNPDNITDAPEEELSKIMW